MIRHFDAFLARQISVIRFADDEFGVYASGRRNRFSTALAFRGTRAEVEEELRRVAPRHPFLVGDA